MSIWITYTASHRHVIHATYSWFDFWSYDLLYKKYRSQSFTLEIPKSFWFHVFSFPTRIKFTHKNFLFSWQSFIILRNTRTQCDTYSVLTNARLVLFRQQLVHQNRTWLHVGEWLYLHHMVHIKYINKDKKLQNQHV